MSLFSRRRIASWLGVLTILVGLYLATVLVYQSVQWARILAPVEDALTMASAQGLIYPEAKPMSAEVEDRYRASEFAATLQHSLSELRTRFEDDPSHDPEITFWLGAGLTVSGNLETARAVVDIGRVHHPFDQRLWNLEVILTLAEGDRALARERLETLIDMFPENALAAKNLPLLTEGG